LHEPAVHSVPLDSGATEGLKLMQPFFNHPICWMN